MRNPFRAAPVAKGEVLVSPKEAREKERQRLLRMHEERGRKARRKLLDSHKNPVHVVLKEKGRSRRKRQQARLRSLSYEVTAKPRREVFE